MILSICLALSFFLGNAPQSKNEPIVTAEPQTTEQQIISREHDVNEIVKARDVEKARTIQAAGFRLLVRVEGQKLAEMLQELWLNTLPKYAIDSYSIDDIKVLVLGDVAVATLAYMQTAHIEGSPRDINGNFMITDVWVKRDGQWKIIERHSSRAEKAPPK
jgi:ketosteroid isomerase-like protein